MKNKILLLIVFILGSIYGTIRSLNKKTSFFSEGQIIRVYDKESNEIIKYDMEDYLVGVLAGEMPASFTPAALKAQAIASRTFAYYKLNSNKEYDVTTDNSSQVYLSQEQRKAKWGDDFLIYENKIKDAINSTKDLVITYDDKIISAYYFAMSNGYTESSLTVFNENKSYLTSVVSNEDVNHRNFKVTNVISKSTFCSKLAISCENINISNIIRNKSDRIEKLTINDKTLDGITIRKVLNLRSTDFEIEVLDNSISITTYGYGHGVGMSQYGANTMAKSGANYKEILGHYYQGTEIQKVTSII